MALSDPEIQESEFAFAYSAESGHPFRRKLITCSAANWTRIPRQTGQVGRNPAGVEVGFYS
jgi:hypothetical protein